MIPVNSPLVAPEAAEYVGECLRSGWISSAGSYLNRFESEFAAYVGTRHAVAVSNGTAALHLALAELEVGAGDEVILPALTIISCLNAVAYTGATPVIVDVEPDIYTLDPARVIEALTTRTKVIMAVHIYGHPAEMDALHEIAQERGIRLVEDAAEAHGATYRGRSCGCLADVACFSFYANKLITTGEGGMVVTDDDARAARLRNLRDLCHVPGQRFHHEEIGFNYRMTNLQAALGCAQLLHARDYLARKERMQSLYRGGLAGLKGLVLPTVRPWATSSYWMYAVRLTDDALLTRDAFRRRLLERNVETRDFFWSLSEQPVLRRIPARVHPCPISERLAREGCYLPSGLALSDGEISLVIEAVAEALAA